MDQVGQHRSSLTKRRFRERFVRPGQNAVARHAGVQDYAHVAFRHMATRTIVQRLLLQSRAQRQFAAFVRVAAGALRREVRGSFRAGRLHVRIVTSYAAESTAAAPITLAENHRVVVLKVVRRRRRFPLRRHQEDRQRVVKRFAWMKISVAFIRLQHAHITRLMAEHANIIGERGWQPARVDDGIASGPHRLSFSRRHLSDVLLSGAVTVLATNGKFPEWWILEPAVTLCRWHCLATVTRRTPRQNRAIESVVPELVPWRQRPSSNSRIE